MSIAWQPVSLDQNKQRQRSISIPLGAQLEPQYIKVNVSTYYFNLNTMESLDFQKLAKFAQKTDITFFMLEVACYTAVVLVKYETDDKLYLEREGVGFRIGVANWAIEFKSSSTLAAVAANAQLDKSQTGIEVKIRGGGLETLPIIQPLKDLLTFDAETLKKISQCSYDLATYFKTNSKNLKPVLFNMAPLNSVEEKDYSYAQFYSGQFAAESIYQKKSFDKAIKEATKQDHPDKILPSFVRAAYSALGIDSPSAVPDGHQIEKAKDILFSGR